jgi:suppressor of G2 allele of SKP1
LKLGSHVDALQDANEALKLDSENGVALLRKGEALFELAEFESALQSFEAGKKTGSKGSWDLWIRKCRAELGDDAPPPSAAEAAVAVQVMAPAAPKIRHEWYQTDSHVIVTVFCKGLKPEQIDKHIGATEYSLNIKLNDDAATTWTQDVELFGEIVPDESRLDLMSTKIELWLKKKAGLRWGSLERKEGSVPAAAGVMLPVEAASTKVEPYAHKKKINWDKFVAEQDDLDSEDPLNKVFKDIYGKGSDEQRRAMMKSYQESGGTVLSTNWDDVGAKTVEVSPPDGMIAKKWGTDEVVAEGGKKKKK